ncbi:hypothetical protein KKI17_01505 [Patescibacteria group bacterium]|nr:hypothetical protein [Patescibacteria group bacterium]
MPKKKERLLVLDANSIIHRAYHALPPLSTSKGELVNALYGFLAVLFKAVKETRPSYVAAAFDLPGPTKRQERFGEYKAQRVAAPDELYAQIPLVKEALAKLGVPVFEKQGYEADDLLGTLAAKAPKGVETVLVSGDLDILQLVDGNTNVYYAKGVQQSQLYDVDKVREHFGGLEPGQLSDFKGLAGDASDNIPGVKGVGKKTAIQLLSSFGTLEGVYEALGAGDPAISKGVAEKLKKGKDLAFVSRELGRIERAVPVAFDLPKLSWGSFDKKEVREFLGRYEFRSLADRLPELREEHEEQDGAREKIERLFAEEVLSEKVRDLELKLIPVLRSMEEYGVKIDREHFRKLAQEMAKELKKQEKAIHAAVGHAFNVNSPAQLSRVLFEELHLSSKGLRKTPKGVVSTASPELEKLQGLHPIVRKLFQYRELSKLSNTYAIPLPRAADEAGRIHTHFDQLGTATGRMSSSAPNLQNVPAQGEWGKRIREGFVAERGWKFVSCDYSQMELRIAAHLADEEKLREAFERGEDIHVRTASEVFGVKAEDVSKEMRARAKALNFGVLYGMGARGFARAAEVSYEEAQAFIDAYFERFPGIQGYLEGVLEQVRELGYAETLWGRRRYLPDIHSRTPQLRAAAERMAVNHGIQGTAADITKQAMVDIYEAFRSDKNVRMLLQIHDELLFEVRDDILHQVAPEFARLMERACSLRVSLRADVKAGANWQTLSPLS